MVGQKPKHQTDLLSKEMEREEHGGEAEIRGAPRSFFQEVLLQSKGHLNEEQNRAPHRKVDWETTHRSRAPVADPHLSLSKCTHTTTYQTTEKLVQGKTRESVQRRRPHRGGEGGSGKEEDLVTRMNRLLTEVAHRTAAFGQSASGYANMPDVIAETFAGPGPPACGVENSKSGEKTGREKGISTPHGKTQAALSSLRERTAEHQGRAARQSSSPVMRQLGKKKEDEEEEEAHLLGQQKKARDNSPCAPSAFHTSTCERETGSAATRLKKLGEDSSPLDARDYFLREKRRRGLDGDLLDSPQGREGSVAPHSTTERQVQTPQPRCLLKTSGRPPPSCSTSSPVVQVDRRGRGRTCREEMEGEAFLGHPPRSAAAGGSSCCKVGEGRGGQDEDQGVSAFLFSRKTSWPRQIRPHEAEDGIHETDVLVEERQSRQIPARLEKKHKTTPTELSAVQQSLPRQQSEEEEEDEEEDAPPPWKQLPIASLADRRSTDLMPVERFADSTVNRHREAVEKDVHPFGNSSKQHPSSASSGSSSTTTSGSTGGGG